MRIDSHQHFWSLERGDYDWITPDLAPLCRDFKPSDLKMYLSQLGIDKTILVQAAPTLAESQYLLSLTYEADFIAGVVGWIDMAADDALAQLALLARHPKLVGIRPMIQDIADPNWMLQPALEPVFQQLIEQQLCFDALVLPVHLDNLLTLLQRYPDLRAVIDHGAKPDIRNQQWAPWADGMKAIAESTQAYCKLSGLLTEAALGAGAKELEPYMTQLLSAFGSERLMWGSDWPVLNLAADYPEWLAICEHFIEQLEPAAREAIMGRNAARFYGV